MANENHDPRTGRFTSSGNAGAATGDHQKNISPPEGPGRQPVKSFPVRAKLKDFKGRITTRGPGAIARERVALNRDVDRRHYPDAAADMRRALTSPRRLPT